MSEVWFAVLFLFIYFFNLRLFSSVLLELGLYKFKITVYIYKKNRDSKNCVVGRVFLFVCNSQSWGREMCQVWLAQGSHAESQILYWKIPSYGCNCDLPLHGMKWRSAHCTLRNRAISQSSRRNRHSLKVELPQGRKKSCSCTGREQRAAQTQTKNV